MQITQELVEILGSTGESLAWKHHPITEQFVKGLESAIGAAQDAWLAGSLMGGGAEATQMRNVAEQAAANVLAQVVEAIERIQLPEKQEHDDGK